MILLASTSDKLQVVTSAAVTVDVHASWVDNNAGTITPGATNTAITTATTTDVVASPASSTQRNIQTVMVRNKGAVPVDITVKHIGGGVTVELVKVTLAANFTLEFLDGVGWVVVVTTVTQTPTVITVASGTTNTVSGPMVADVLVSWQSATSGTKTQTIPTGTGSGRMVTVADGNGNAGVAGQSIVVAPAAGSIIGSTATTTIIDNYGSITFIDIGASLWQAI